MNSLMKAFLIMAVASANGMVTSASSGVHIVSLAPAPPYYIPPIDNIFYDVHRSPFPDIEALFSHLCLFVVACYLLEGLVDQLTSMVGNGRPLMP